MRILVVALFGLIACQEEEKEETPVYPDVDLYDFSAYEPWYEGSELEVPPEASIVSAFDFTDQYFGSENFRDVQMEVDFPASGDWAQVGLLLYLSCPDSGRCDLWDRSASIQLILDPESESPESVEIIRYITPYGKQMYKYVDITPMASLLQGKQTLSSWIDTWVGPGHSDGDGWRVTTQFVFYPGPPAAADEVINIWGRRNITVGQLGEGETVADQIAEQTFSIPADATRVEAHLVTTGHSFGNTLNCAEFCEMRHDLYINGAMHSVNPWRSDCEENPVSPQFGSWEHDRNGWCPGAVSIGDVIDITDSVDIGGENTLNFDILRGNGAVYNNVSPVDLLPYTILSLKLYIYR